MLSDNPIKPNHKAIRVASSIIQTAVLQTAFMSLFTLIIVHRKEYGYFKLGLIAVGLGIGVDVAALAATNVLTRIVKKAEPRQAQNCKISRILAQGPKDNWSALVTSIGVSIVFSVVLELLSRNNMLDLDPSASRKGLIVLFTLLGLFTSSLLRSALNPQPTLTEVEISGKEGFALAWLEGGDTENSLINSVVAQVRANSHCKAAR